MSAYNEDDIENLEDDEFLQNLVEAKHNNSTELMKLRQKYMEDEGMNHIEAYGKAVEELSD